MPTRAIPSFAEEIEADEGRRRFPYKDSRGFWTCGVGCNLTSHGFTPTQITAIAQAPKGWSDATINQYRDKDIAAAEAALDFGAPWWRKLDTVRQRVLLNMDFNMGWLSPDGKHGLATFGPTLQFIQNGDYDMAAAHMAHSAWAKEVGARADRLCARMRTGQYFPST